MLRRLFESRGYARAAACLLASCDGRGAGSLDGPSGVGDNFVEVARRCQPDRVVATSAIDERTVTLELARGNGTLRVSHLDFGVEGCTDVTIDAVAVDPNGAGNDFRFQVRCMVHGGTAYVGSGTCEVDGDDFRFSAVLSGADGSSIVCGGTPP